MKVNYIVTSQRETMRSARCPECGSKSLLYQYGKLTCRNCLTVIHTGKKRNKFNARKTRSVDGLVRDSCFESNVADELYLRKKTGDIKDYDSQFKVEIPLFNESGDKCMSVKHRVDFRIHENDGSFTLYEVKGVETQDYKWRRSLLEKFWLPLHKDHTYKVRKQK